MEGEGRAISAGEPTGPGGRPLSVLHVSQPTEAGVRRIVAALAADQARRGWRVAVACPPGGLAADLLGTGADWLPWPAARSPGPGMPGELLRLRRIVRTLRPDVVHLHSSKAGLVGRLAVRGRRPTIFEPNAWSFHAAGRALRGITLAWERAGARWAVATLCVSQRERDEGVRAGVRAAWYVIPNGVDTEALATATAEDRAAARVRLGLPSDAGLAVCVGRLSRQKGQDVLLAAWPRVRERCPDARLVLVGDGPLRERLARALPPGAELAGERDDVADWLAAADVVVQPSRWEGMSLALLEAMARGRAIVATDVAGAREALGDETGAVVAAESPEALAEATAARLADPALCSREGAANRKAVERRFSLRSVHEAIAALTLEVSARGTVRGGGGA